MGDNQRQATGTNRTLLPPQNRAMGARGSDGAFRPDPASSQMAPAWISAEPRPLQLKKGRDAATAGSIQGPPIQLQRDPNASRDAQQVEDNSAGVSVASTSGRLDYEKDPRAWKAVMAGRVAADHRVDEGGGRLDMGIANQTVDGRRIPGQDLQERTDQGLRELLKKSPFGPVLFDRFYYAMDAEAGRREWTPETQGAYKVIEAKTRAMFAEALADVAATCGPDVGIRFRDGTRFTRADLVTADGKPQQDRILVAAHKVMQLCYEKARADVLGGSIDLRTCNEWEMNLHWIRSGNDFVVREDTEVKKDTPKPDQNAGPGTQAGAGAQTPGTSPATVPGTARQPSASSSDGATPAPGPASPAMAPFALDQRGTPTAQTGTTAPGTVDGQPRSTASLGPTGPQTGSSARMPGSPGPQLPSTAGNQSDPTAKSNGPGTPSPTGNATAGRTPDKPASTAGADRRGTDSSTGKTGAVTNDGRPAPPVPGSLPGRFTSDVVNGEVHVVDHTGATQGHGWNLFYSENHWKTMFTLQFNVKPIDGTYYVIFHDQAQTLEARVALVRNQRTDDLEFPLPTTVEFLYIADNIKKSGLDVNQFLKENLEAFKTAAKAASRADDFVGSQDNIWQESDAEKGQVYAASRGTGTRMPQRRMP